MRKIFSILVLFVAVITATNASAESRWGIEAGANYNFFPAYQRGLYKLYDTDNSIGATVGLKGEIFFSGIGFGIDGALLYNYAEAKTHLGQQEIWASQGLGTQKVGLHYLEIPLNLKYRYINMNGFENTLYPFVFGGPNVNFLLKGSDKDNFMYTTTSLGLHAGFGIELFRKLQISASHEWGLSQMFKTKLLEDNAHKLRTWHVRLTYMF